MALDLTSLLPGLDDLQFLINLEGALQVAQGAMSGYTKYIIGNMGKFITNALILFVALYGFAFMKGAIKEPVNDFSIRMFKIMMVAFLSTSFASYNDYIAQWFWDLPEDLITRLTPPNAITYITNLLPSGPTTNTDRAIMLISTLMSAVVQIMHNNLLASDINGTTDPTLFAAGLGIGVAGASISAVVAGVLLVAKMSLSVLLALGPFFLVTILFEKTKHFFDGWLSQVLNFVLVVILLTLTIYVLFPVLIITVSGYYLLSEVYGALSLKESVELMTLLGIFLAVIRQVPTTAAAIVRGYAVSPPGQQSIARDLGGAQPNYTKTDAQTKIEQANQR
jgi:type IV secretion system protein VirB6